MAEKKPMIVIKKINVVAAGHHGGSWKVALADFMTALMAFFLVMWLLGASEETKKAISDYFSTPSIIEYNFQNFGAEITLEKLFLDIVNEPMKAIQSFMEPADKTPNILDFTSPRVILAFVIDQLQDYARSIEMNTDGFTVEISDEMLFEQGSARPTKKYITILDKLVGVTTGLEDADITVLNHMLVTQVEDGNPRTALRVSSERLEMIKTKIQAGLEHKSVSVQGNMDVRNPITPTELNNPKGFVRITVKQKPLKSNGRVNRPIEERVDLNGQKLDKTALRKVQINSVRDDETQKVRAVSSSEESFGKDESLQNPINEDFKSTTEPQE
jgi:chemotaxis protein MotB